MNWLSQIKAFYDGLAVNPLGPNAICLYNTLLYLNNKSAWKKSFTVANLTLQSLCTMSRKQVHNARNELIQKGYIEYEKGVGNQSGQYLIVTIGTQMSTQTDTSDGTRDGMQMAHSLTTLNKHKPKQNKSTCADGFDRFWSAYPRKVGKAKAQAAFAKLAPDQELLAHILEAIEKARQSDQWMRDNGQYIPYPATWLNGCRWEDEITVNVSKSAASGYEGVREL